MTRLGLLCVFVVLLPLLADGNKLAYYSSHARPEQCAEGGSGMLIYSYIPHSTMVRLASVFDGVSWAKSGVLSTPSEGSGMEKAIRLVQTEEMKTQKNARVVQDIESLSSAIDTVGELDDIQIIELAIESDLLEKKRMSESSLKGVIQKVQAHSCGTILFLEKVDAGKKTKEAQTSMLFGEGLFGSTAGVDRVLSSSSSSSSSSNVNMTPDTLVGLMLGASFLATILIGLGCMNDLRGASTFTDEKSIPPVGKES